MNSQLQGEYKSNPENPRNILDQVNIDVMKLFNHFQIAGLITLVGLRIKQATLCQINKYWY